MKNKLQQYQDELAHELTSILNYWKDNTIDHDHGGFHGKIDHFNRVIPDAPKGAVLNARILWTFSAAFRYTQNQDYVKIARRAFEYLKDHFYDAEHGGLIWQVDTTGKPINTRKQIYAQGFGIYGFSEYFRATGERESLSLAKELYSLIEKHSYDGTFGGYLEAFGKDWQTLADMRLSERDENYPKSMNTHLHILEPYTNLYRVWKNDGLKEKIKSLIRIFLDNIIAKDSGHFHLFFESSWDVRSNIVSYGHDIEGAWLLTEAAEAIDDTQLFSELQRVVLKMTDATIEEGMDQDHGVFYEKNMLSDHLDTDKHWWPQAEAMIGFFNAFEISGNEKYLDHSIKSWRFIQDSIQDNINGEWFWRVNIEGKPIISDDKAGFWKCPYHNSRACLEIIERISSMLLKLS